jgi:hypothetical protein
MRDFAPVSRFARLPKHGNPAQSGLIRVNPTQKIQEIGFQFALTRNIL